MTDDLVNALAAAGVKIDADALTAILRGAAAAPDPLPPWRWTDVVGGDLPDDLVARLETAREAVRETGDAISSAAKLEKLHAALAEQDLQGFVLPRTDRFGSEYLPASDERVAWLTGFSGSAARVIVLPESAAVFTDGRYTLQVHEQTDPALFETPDMETATPTDWLKERVEPGWRIGYDPVLHLKADAERLGRALALKGAVLVAVETNPVDAIWTDQPAPPLAAIRLHPAEFAGETSLAKRERLLIEANKLGAEAILITTGDGIAWLFNIRGGDIPYNPLCLGIALVRKDATAVLFTDPNKAPPGFAFEDAGLTLRSEADWPAALADLQGAGERLLADPKLTHAGFLQEIEAAGVTLVEGADPLAPAKAVKNAVEIAGSRAAHRRDGAALCRFLAWLDRTSGVDELAAVAHLEAERRKEERYRGPSFPTISGAGPNGAIVHYSVDEASNRPLDRNSLYLVDSGGQYLDATTDVTRTVAIGTPSDSMRRHATLVLKGHIALATAVFPKGTTGTQLDGFARRPLWEAGLDFDHGTGHGIGSFLCVHEGPQRIAKRGETPALEPGMILSNEPGYYASGRYGIRLENLVLVTDLGTPNGGDRQLYAFETLTLAPFDRRLIDTKLLTAAEADWLNDYHAYVLQEIGPRLDGADLHWLQQATKALG